MLLSSISEGQGSAKTYHHRACIKLFVSCRAIILQLIVFEVRHSLFRTYYHDISSSLHTSWLYIFSFSIVSYDYARIKYENLGEIRKKGEEFVQVK